MYKHFIWAKKLTSNKDNCDYNDNKCKINELKEAETIGVHPNV
jgi:hypothetical protein